MKDKIKITKISKLCFAQKGFEKNGCLRCNCKDSCCKDTGADFDKESYDFVMSHKNLIEPLIKEKIENCFKKSWSRDKEFLGKNSIRSVKGDRGYCIFHNPKGKGCILYNLVNTNKINPTSGQAPRYQGEFFMSSIGSADDLIAIALHPRGKPRGVRAPIINKRIVPSICRLFPLSWEHGKLIVYTEQKEKGCVIPRDCNCVKSENTTSKNILETQKNAINDIFDIDIR